jgi:hypothetical protein
MPGKAGNIMTEFMFDLATVAQPAGYGAYAFLDSDGSSRGFVQLIWDSPRAATLHRLWTLKRGAGNGAMMLSKLCELADRHGIEISLKPLPFGRKPYPLAGQQLATWYRRYGFVGNRKKLVRRPAGAAEHVERVPRAQTQSLLRWILGGFKRVESSSPVPAPSGRRLV